MHPLPIAMLIFTMISIRTYSVLNTHTISIGNRFPWLYIVFSLPDSIISSQYLVYSCSKCQEGGCRFLKKGGGDIQKGGIKKDTPFRTMLDLFLEVPFFRACPFSV